MIMNDLTTTTTTNNNNKNNNNSHVLPPSHPEIFRILMTISKMRVSRRGFFEFSMESKVERPNGNGMLREIHQGYCIREIHQGYCILEYSFHKFKLVKSSLAWHRYCWWLVAIWVVLVVMLIGSWYALFLSKWQWKEQFLVGWEGSPGKMHLKKTAPVQICSVSQAIGFLLGNRMLLRIGLSFKQEVRKWPLQGLSDFQLKHQNKKLIPFEFLILMQYWS